jgi:hypothetical protein
MVFACLARPVVSTFGCWKRCIYKVRPQGRTSGGVVQAGRRVGKQARTRSQFCARRFKAIVWHPPHDEKPSLWTYIPHRPHRFDIHLPGNAHAYILNPEDRASVNGSKQRERSRLRAGSEGNLARTGRKQMSDIDIRSGDHAHQFTYLANITPTSNCLGISRCTQPRRPLIKGRTKNNPYGIEQGIASQFGAYRPEAKPMRERQTAEPHPSICMLHEDRHVDVKGVGDGIYI